MIVLRTIFLGAAIVFFGVFVAGNAAAAENTTAADNVLTSKEKKDGWRLLFNGRDHTGWRCNNGKKIATPVDQGSLVPYKSGGYLVLHDDLFADFVLRCDVRWEAEHCNSGIFFRVSDKKNPVHTGFEVQVMSGAGLSKHDMGAIYDLAAPTKNMGKPAGEWNAIEIRCQGPNIQVKVNGRVVSTLNCDDFDQPGVCPDGQKHKFKIGGKPVAVKNFARRGYLGFQDHGQRVWYKNIRLLEL